MIKVKIKHEGEYIKQFEISGHAESGPYGQDLVCAAVSGIVFGALNALDIHFNKDADLNVLENKIIIKSQNSENQSLQIMLKMLKVQLSTIQSQYKQFIEIMEVC
ncbi:ribosomal-processing cysteine protease Prp [Mesoplasma chauliocola]|uniref:Ribosomal processing cysteine protease Prp n=1 Tax=Mesoplasma chauliocola TaxID=216427 RepID=A0A249SNM3_9MOLU|nr:ribosomal-processing cysteine protease Prp [Mesoplasma chauliocola]ASZ09212.1 ribosomal-processing cysteine protease Prp [Mesoplasma chauliocola]